MRSLRAFTLIELLIVVAIIAILAAIAVPNFLEAQVRSKVSRVRSDMRSMATGLESYYIDNNQYPALAFGAVPAAESADSQFLGTTAGPGRTFRLRTGTAANLSTMTTPVAYLTSLFSDPFADTRGLGFRYYAEGPGWILNSFGPDTDQGTTQGDLGFNDGSTAAPDEEDGIETVYDSRNSQPSSYLIVGILNSPGQRGAFTYDPTNGTTSEGDVWRTKQ